MTMNPEVKKVIQMIEERIESLKTMRDMLMKEFGYSASVSPSPISESSHVRPVIGTTIPPTTAPATIAPTTVPPDEGATRKETLINFLNQNGPQKRKEIVGKTGIPIGTVSYLLNDKETFERVEGNKWKVRYHNLDEI